MLWKNKHTTLDLLQEPDELAEILLAMDQEYDAVKYPQKREDV